jgi:hypothetical protein
MAMMAGKGDDLARERWRRPRAARRRGRRKILASEGDDGAAEEVHGEHAWS